MSEILPFYQLKIVDSTQLELKRMLRQQGELDSFTTRYLLSIKLRVAVEGCQSGTIHRVVVCYCPYMSIGPFR